MKTLFDYGLEPPAPPSYVPDPAKIRARLHALLDKARGAETMPWPDREARMWKIVFPQTANWLPEEERDRLRAEFAAEIARLAEAPQ